MSVCSLHMVPSLAGMDPASFALGGAVTAVAAATSAGLWWRSRRKGRISDFTRVNCWFCNSDQNVPVRLSRHWRCIYCSSYNGFNEVRGGDGEDVPLIWCRS